MNCYNGEKYLRQALGSIVNQAYQNWELIFWDNQSTDNSKIILESYQDDRLKYHYAEKHTMLYEARNCAVKKANGEFLTFLDVDDIWELDKLEKQLLLFDDEMVGLVYGNYIELDELTKQQQPMFDKKLPIGWVVDELLDFYVVGLLTIMVRRKAFDSLEKQFDNRFHIIGDFDLVLRMSVHWKFDCVQETLAYYRQHGDNESGKHRDKFIEESLTWYSEMRYHSDFSEKEEIYKKYDLFLYHDAILRKIEGKKIKTVFSIFTMLPLGVLKLKLLIIIFLPKIFYNLLTTRVVKL
jgi:glycosyltransferase involved in cell wall biosynthesis